MKPTQQLNIFDQAWNKSSTVKVPDFNGDFAAEMDRLAKLSTKERIRIWKTGEEAK